MNPRSSTDGALSERGARTCSSERPCFGAAPPDDGPTARSGLPARDPRRRLPADDDPPPERGLPARPPLGALEGGRDSLLCPPRSLSRCRHRNSWSHPRNPATPRNHPKSCEGIPHRIACRSLTIPLDRVSLPRYSSLLPCFTGGTSHPDPLNGPSHGPTSASGRSHSGLGASPGLPPPESEKGRPNGATLFERMSGSVLLSHKVPLAVPSALRSLASGFGMGPGVSLSL